MAQEGGTVLGGITATQAARGGDDSRRERRLAWLASVRATLGAAAPLIDRADAFGIEIADMHARVAAALAATDACGSELGEAIDANALARELEAAAAHALAAQATIDEAAARRIMGESQEAPPGGEPPVKIPPSWSSSGTEADR